MTTSPKWSFPIQVDDLDVRLRPDLAIFMPNGGIHELPETCHRFANNEKTDQ
jgi:hypothetical protein